MNIQVFVQFCIYLKAVQKAGTFCNILWYSVNCAVVTGRVIVVQCELCSCDWAGYCGTV